MNDSTANYALPQALISAATYGFKLFPVCRDNKKPLFEKWPERATGDVAQLAQWAAKYPGCNWAMATGQASGVFVVDLDGPDGEAWARALALPESLIVSTGKGCHVYFLAPVNVIVRNSAGTVAPGVDIRGDGGYVVIPPSIHANGNPYKYLNAVGPMVAPDWLVALLTQDRPASAPATTQEPRQGATEAEKAFGVNAMRKACADFAAIPAGKGLRNHAANKLAFTVAGLVAAGWVDANAANEAIKEATAVYRSQDSSAEGTLRSGWYKGVLKPCAPLPIDTHAEYVRSQGFTINGRSLNVEVVNPIQPKALNQIELTAMSSIQAEAIQWLWDKWLPLGKMVLLAGAPGTGKSTLAFNMAAIASRGGKWADGTQCAKPVHVLLWSSEDDAADTISPRLQAMNANLDYIHLVNATTQNGERRPFNPATDMEALKSMMKSNDVSLLVIDPIVSAVTGDMNKSNEVRKGLQAIVDFASEINCCVLGITHFAKGTTGRNPAERVIGSVAFGAFARMVLVAARDEETDNRVFVRAKSNISADTGGFNYEIEVTTLDQSHIKATRIVWGNPIEGSSREILANVEHQENSKDGDQDKIADAKAYLLEALKAGPKPATRLTDDAVALGIASVRTINKAKKELKIRSKKQGSEWFWMEPLPVIPAGEFK